MLLRATSPPSLFVDRSRWPANYYDYLIMIGFERHNIDITVPIMKQRSELSTNSSELWHNDINIDIT
jgi:hypothetical protein